MRKWGEIQVSKDNNKNEPGTNERTPFLGHTGKLNWIRAFSRGAFSKRGARRTKKVPNQWHLSEVQEHKVNNRKRSLHVWSARWFSSQAQMSPWNNMQNVLGWRHYCVEAPEQRGGFQARDRAVRPPLTLAKSLTVIQIKIERTLFVPGGNYNVGHKHISKASHHITHNTEIIGRTKPMWFQM